MVCECDDETTVFDDVENLRPLTMEFFIKVSIREVVVNKELGKGGITEAT